MCGICGVVYHDPNRTVCPQELQRMNHTLTHRGPDDEGYFVEGPVGFGMRRLSVIDLVTGQQPISNEDGRIWGVFNGEIYNYPELRKTLEQKGHTFSTNTDSETIVHAYEAYGEDCVKAFNGMFAFAIWDGRKRKLVLARDRLGIKPLYYYLNERCLVFGSELKALLAHREVPRAIDFNALDSLLTFEYIPAPLSIFHSIHKLLPGHILVWQEGTVVTRQYWDLQTNSLDIPEEECGDAFYELLQDAVRMRLMSDVPLGAFLSGGIGLAPVFRATALALTGSRYHAGQLVGAVVFRRRDRSLLNQD